MGRQVVAWKACHTNLEVRLVANELPSNAMLELVEYLISGAMWLVAGPLHRRRIARFFADRGERVQTIEWAPLSTGWMSHWHDRFYAIVYEDTSGNSHTVTCRTSWRSGVMIASEEEDDAEA